MNSSHAESKAFWTEPSFNDFIALPSLLRWGLAWGTIEQDKGNKIGIREVMDWMIDRYDPSVEILPIGVFSDILERFVREPVNLRMVRCFVDNHCNMIATKLAWREDY